MPCGSHSACAEAAEGATVWVHDYNLWLAPGFIREQVGVETEEAVALRQSLWTDEMWRRQLPCSSH